MNTMNTMKNARSQFGILSVYHFFCMPLGLLLSLLATLNETGYKRTGNKFYKQMAQVWRRLFLINAAVGVATRIAQEF